MAFLGIYWHGQIYSEEHVIYCKDQFSSEDNLSESAVA